MQEYFVLEAEPSSSLHATLDAGEGSNMDLRWLDGRLMGPKELTAPLQILVEDPPEDGGYPDFMDVGHGPAVSLAFRDAIMTFPITNVEFHAARVVEDAGPRPEPYFMMNVIGRLDALDRTRAQVTTFKKRIFRMNSMAIDPVGARDQDVFRIHDYSDVIIVSRRIADGLRSASLTGFMLSPAEGWSDKHRF